MNPAIALLVAVALFCALSLAVAKALGSFLKRAALLDRRIYGDMPNVPDVKSLFHDAPYPTGGQDDHA